MSSKHSFNNFIHCHSSFNSVNWSCRHLIQRSKNTISCNDVNSHHLISLHLPSAIAHSLTLSACSSGVTAVSVTRSTSFFCFSTCLILSRSEKELHEYDNMHVLHSLTLGAVHIHPWCHTRGLSVWRNSHTRVWVQSCFLWADPHRLADQLVTSEGWVPGKSRLTLLFWDI